MRIRTIVLCSIDNGNFLLVYSVFFYYPFISPVTMKHCCTFHFHCISILWPNAGDLVSSLLACCMLVCMCGWIILLLDAVCGYVILTFFGFRYVYVFLFGI